ncbi:MAG TPA: hypothetical protein DEU90_20240 [Enterobacter asburiae]|nr:hypothetical protein DP195_02360 [Enterobacter asburiae]HBW96469.1 hypothetical protein [Enterobacter asburiae]HCF69840.1 hypothetical protein [Enterobacter asburiae]
MPEGWPDVDSASCCILCFHHTDYKTSTDCRKNWHADTVLADLYVKQKLFLSLYCTGRFPG